MASKPMKVTQSHSVSEIRENKLKTQQDTILHPSEWLRLKTDNSQVL